MGAEQQAQRSNIRWAPDQSLSSHQPVHRTSPALRPVRCGAARSASASPASAFAGPRGIGARRAPRPHERAALADIVIKPKSRCTYLCNIRIKAKAVNKKPYASSRSHTTLDTHAPSLTLCETHLNVKRKRCCAGLLALDREVRLGLCAYGGICVRAARRRPHLPAAAPRRTLTPHG